VPHVTNHGVVIARKKFKCSNALNALIVIAMNAHIQDKHVNNCFDHSLITYMGNFAE
jgi:hypothetical protein